VGIAETPLPAMRNENGVGDFKMLFFRSATAWLAGAAVSIAGVACLSAFAADLPLKAPPVPVVGPSVPLDVHGNLDITLATNRVTGGGLLLYPSGTALTQINGGLALDLYKNPTGFINGITVYGGVWNEFWVGGRVPGARAWQEMDAYAGVSIAFAEYWKLSAEYVQFNFPNAIPTAYNSVYTLSYSDAHLGWWFPFNPYVSLFYNMDGGSTVVFGKTSDTFRVTFGIVPTFSFFKDSLFPLTVALPTSVTIGPTEFWNRNDGTTNVCGATGLAPCALSNLGVVTTGIDAKWSLDKVIPKRLGSWYFKASGHYYSIENDALLAAQVVTGAATSFSNAKRDVVIGSLSFGMSF
jgi:hypothetical protein